MTHRVMMRMLRGCCLLGFFFFAFAQLSPGVEAGQAGRRLQSGGSASAPREILIIPPLVPQFRCFHFGSADRALERV